MLTRYLLFGLAGWSTEVVFRGASAALQRDRSATATTCLWVHTIHGAAGLALDWLSRRMQRVPKPLRPLPYRRAIYAPTWWLLGDAFESLRDWIEMIEKAWLTSSLPEKPSNEVARKAPKMLPAVEREEN